MSTIRPSVSVLRWQTADPTYIRGKNRQEIVTKSINSVRAKSGTDSHTDLMSLHIIFRFG